MKCVKVFGSLLTLIVFKLPNFFRICKITLGYYVTKNYGSVLHKVCFLRLSVFYNPFIELIFIK